MDVHEKFSETCINNLQSTKVLWYILCYFYYIILYYFMLFIFINFYVILFQAE